MTYKLIIKRFLPFLLPLALIPEYSVDYFRYLRYSGILGVKNSDKKLIGKIIAEYHVIEKGLTMPDTRLGFGRENLISLINNCREYIHRFGNEDIQLQQAISVIIEYRGFHLENRYSLDINLLERIKRIESEKKETEVYRQINSTKEEYFQNTNSPFYIFSSTRRSIRNFSKEEVPLSKIKDAIDVARNTPSSCNRQGTRIYVFAKQDQINQILSIQGGNRGFGHLSNKLIIITCQSSRIFCTRDKANFHQCRWHICIPDHVEVCLLHAVSQ